MILLEQRHCKVKRDVGRQYECGERDEVLLLDENGYPKRECDYRRGIRGRRRTVWFYTLRTLKHTRLATDRGSRMPDITQDSPFGHS